MQLIDRPGEVDGEISFRSRKNDEIVDIGKLNPKGKKVREIRGGEISMIFQEPMEAFSPIHTIGNQIIEGILLHITKDKDEARKLAIETLKQVGISNPEQINPISTRIIWWNETKSDDRHGLMLQSGNSNCR